MDYTGKNDTVRLYNKGIIFVHFPENGHHGCGKHCQFCLFDRLDYNIPITPTDEEVLNFLSLVLPGHLIQICGAGDPLFNFDKNKDYLLHIIDLIHSTGRQVELVTKYTEVIAEFIDTDLAVVDTWLLSVEQKADQILALIDDITSRGKKIRISKVANLTDDIHAIDYDFLDSYVAFYSNITHKENLSICFRPNFNFKYQDKDVDKERVTIDKMAIKYGCRVYMHPQSCHIATPQL